MVNINRKQIENYYELEWSELASPKTVNLLIELTCKAYHLNQPTVSGFGKEKEPPKPQNLGQI